MLESVLVANRGEIALRIVRACRDLGVRCVVAHSEADAGSPAVRLADGGALIGPAPARESYLDVDAVVTAAVDSGTEAIHPGYGFLAENAALADAASAAGLTFVGPAADTMRILGDKRSGRAAAERAGLPVLPARIVASDTDIDASLASEIGLPALVKAAFGGGGRGMRRVDTAQELATTIAAARRESTAAFGHDDVYLERLVERPRHVEVQILADDSGEVRHLGTRDCTLQRRHQKLIEEAPAPHLPDDVRAAMLAGAVRLATEVGYRGAGTVEFLFDPTDGGFFFLEVNTRLQVEHTVTELVTGVDLVVAQLLVAGGRTIGFDQDDVSIRGHAIEARILAEDPGTGFLPATGTISALDIPSGPWVRVDSGVGTGTEVTAHYDSLLMKVCALGSDRTDAIDRMRRAIGELRVEGVPTTAGFLAGAVGSRSFRDMSHCTASVDAGELDDTIRSSAEAPPDLRAGGGAVAAAAPAERLVTIATGHRELEIAIPSAGVSPASPALTTTRTGRTSSTGAAPSAGAVAPMDATVVHFTVAVGDEIEAGATVAIVESMKLETHVTTNRSGVVTAVLFAAGDLVRRGDLLVDVSEPADD